MMFIMSSCVGPVLVSVRHSVSCNEFSGSISASASAPDSRRDASAAAPDTVVWLPHDASSSESSDVLDAVWRAVALLPAWDVPLPG